MKIAYIVPYVPNQIRTRSYNLITQLSKLGHEVDVFTVGSNEKDWQDAEALNHKCRKVTYFHQSLQRSLINSLGASISGRPLQSVYSWQPQLARHLFDVFSKKDGSPYEVVHVEHLRGSQYGVWLKKNFPQQAVVWDSVDCISHLFKQASAQSSDLFGKLVTRFELNRTRNLEGKLLNCFEHVLVTSSVDRDALLQLANNKTKVAPISVVSNGVDQDFFHPNQEIEREPATLVFSGKMSYHANISMVKYLVTDIMPRIWKKRPKTQLYIVGKDPSTEIKEMGKNSLIHVTGTVDDIRPFLWRATISVVPLLYGAGIQNKILEAMATGTPVVTTYNSLSAFNVQVGKHLIAADRAEDFSQSVLQLLENRNLQSEIGANGISYVRTYHSWPSIAEKLVDIYQQSSTTN